MGLKEILAAKKAAAEAAAKATEVVTIKVPVEVAVVVEAAPEKAVSALQDFAEEVKQEARAITSVPVSDKPLTFAEKMALKKSGVMAAQAAPQAPKQVAPLAIDPSQIPEDPADAQAYVDIKTKIHNLEAMFDDDLKNAMSELKQALKKNPNATELMLDSDVGKMVTALRRMTHVAQVEATTKTKAGKTKTAVKAKDAVLTKEEIEAAFNDL